jgi:hypothetical protein
MRPRNFPGSTYSNDPSDTQSVLTTSANVTVFTDQVFIRARARQMALRVASNTEGVQWQLGSPRLMFDPMGAANGVSWIPGTCLTTALA